MIDVPGDLIKDDKRDWSELHPDERESATESNKRVENESEYYDGDRDQD